MTGKNHGLCHSCRCKGHFFVDCPKKCLCPWCKCAFVKCFEVENETQNKGKLFNCCGEKCDFWEWVGDGKSSYESRVDSAASTNTTMNESVANVTSIFKSSLRLSNEQEFKLSVKVTIRNNNTISEVSAKGKAHV